MYTHHYWLMLILYFLHNNYVTIYVLSNFRFIKKYQQMFQFWKVILERLRINGI